MVEKVRVVNAKTNEVIREGFARHSDVSQEKKILGFLTLTDALKIGSILVGTIVFLVQSDNRLKRVEDTQVIMTRTLDKLIDFTDGSDGWHSARFGTQFKGGKPIDGTFKIVPRILSEKE